MRHWVVSEVSDPSSVENEEERTTSESGPHRVFDQK